MTTDERARQGHLCDGSASAAAGATCWDAWRAALALPTQGTCERLHLLVITKCLAPRSDPPVPGCRMGLAERLSGPVSGPGTDPGLTMFRGGSRTASRCMITNLEFARFGLRPEHEPVQHVQHVPF